MKGRSFVLTSKIGEDWRMSMKGEFCKRVLSQMFRVAEQQRRWTDFESCGNDVWLCRTVCRDGGGGEGGKRSDGNDDCDMDCDADTN